MKTLMKVPIEPVYVKFIPMELEEGKLYISKEYEVAIHNCLCGCKGRTVTPFKMEPSSDPFWWQLIEHGDRVVSLEGSIGNYQMKCKSHYVITKNIASFC